MSLENLFIFQDFSVEKINELADSIKNFDVRSKSNFDYGLNSKRKIYLSRLDQSLKNARASKAERREDWLISGINEKLSNSRVIENLALVELRKRLQAQRDKERIEQINRTQREQQAQNRERERRAERERERKRIEQREQDERERLARERSEQRDREDRSSRVLDAILKGIVGGVKGYTDSLGNGYTGGSSGGCPSGQRFVYTGHRECTGCPPGYCE